MTDFFSMVEILRNNKRDLKGIQVCHSQFSNQCPLQFIERYRDKKDHEIMLLWRRPRQERPPHTSYWKPSHTLRICRANWEEKRDGKDLNEVTESTATTTPGAGGEKQQREEGRKNPEISFSSSNTAPLTWGRGVYILRYEGTAVSPYFIRGAVVITIITAL